MRTIGSSVPVHDAQAKVTGACLYTDDLEPADILYAKLLYSKEAHAKIVSVDSTEAEAMEGVVAVLSCFNTTPRFYNSAKRFDEQEVPQDEQIFPRIVQHVGDRVAAVVAERPEQALRALKAIKVEYEPLPAIFDPEEALALEDSSGLYAKISTSGGDLEAGFSQADAVFEGRKETEAIHHLALEPHSVIAECRNGKKATVWTSTQTTFAVRMLLSELFGFPRSRIRVVKPVMGGGFGAKIPMILEPVALAAAIKTGRPVKLTLSRKEAFFATRMRHASKTRIKTGVKKDGTIVAQDITILFNGGAYCTQSINVGAATVHDIVNCFRTPNIKVTALPVRTNLPVAGAMRGYGSPQMHFALQTHLAQVARQLGIDFYAFLERNLVRPDALSPVGGRSLGNPRPLDCLHRGGELFGWKAKSALPREVGKNRFRGVGIGVGTHGNGVFGAHLDYTGIRVRMNEDDTVLLFTGSHDMGNGSVTVQKMIVSQELNVPLERIEAVESDTENCPYNLGDYASRGVFVSAEAARRAAISLRALILEKGGGLTGRPSAELSLGTEALLGADGKALMSRKDLFRRINQELQQDLEVTESWANAAGRTSYGVHFAEVEVDGNSGEVDILSYVAVHDVGKVLNRQGIEGQLEGGIHMSTGYALSEELRFDEKGAVVNGSLGRYNIIRASRMPKELIVDFIEEGEEPGPYGAKSIGECAAVPGAAAIANAVADALGVEVDHIPLTPKRVLALLSLKNGDDICPA